MKGVSLGPPEPTRLKPAQRELRRHRRRPTLARHLAPPPLTPYICASCAGDWMRQHPQEIRFCRSRDGTGIAYAISGQGPPLVWIQHWVHHLEIDLESPIWKPWLVFLTRRHTLVRYDWRGCGLSDRHGIQFDLESYVADLDAVIEAAQIERFCLFGMAGAGSGAAMAYAARNADRVSCLVLQGPQTKGRIAGKATAQQMEEARARLKVIELGWPNGTPAYGQFFTALHIPDASVGHTRAYNDLLRRTTTPANGVRLLRSFWEADMTEFASAVRCPTLVVHARGDSVIPFEEGRRIASLVPRARFMPIESRNHLLLETDPEWTRFVGALDEFLSAFGPSAAPALLTDLTAREREILGLLAGGHDNREIARRLIISEKTVRNHISQILGKLGVHHRSQAIVLAREHGYGTRSR
ncbi:MAG: alpha/beta fold hydrolase [Rhodospirillales bacterium]|nr:alpha/beta fold hydrolase [Rhodospirillales bacterium]